MSVLDFTGKSDSEIRRMLYAAATVHCRTEVEFNLEDIREPGVWVQTNRYVWVTSDDKEFDILEDAIEHQEEIFGDKYRA